MASPTGGSWSEPEPEEKKTPPPPPARYLPSPPRFPPARPRTFALPAWAKTPMGPLADEFAIHASSGDGNCFFESLRQILASARVQRTIAELRQLVAKPILDTDNVIVNRTIQNWWELYRDGKKERNAQIMEEYKQMGVLPDDVTLPLGDRERWRLFQAMLTPLYWGEQHACRIIEEQTQMRFLLFSGDTQRPALTWYHSTAFKPTHYCFLFNAQQHYMAVSFRGRYIFKWDEVPVEVQTFFSQAYVQVNPRAEANNANTNNANNAAQEPEPTPP